MDFRISETETETELDEIYKNISETENFSQVSKALLKDSRVLLLFRLQEDFDRNKFAKSLGKSVNTIANIERGNKKITTTQKANQYVDNLGKFATLPLDIKTIKTNYNKWLRNDLDGRKKRALKYASFGGKKSAKNLSAEQREQRAKLGGITAKLKNAGIHSKRHLWMEWFKEGLKKSGRRTSIGPKNEKMLNELEAIVARKLFSLNAEYRYEPLFKVQDQIFYPDFMVSNTIIECCYWEHEDRWLYLASKFVKIYGSGFKCILVTKRSCRKFLHLIPDFVTVIMDEKIDDLGAYLLPYGCQPPR